MKKKPVNKDNADLAANKGKAAEKQHVTFLDKIKRRISTTRLVFSVLSVILYTVFTLVMLLKNWGSTVYLTIILGFVGLYVLLFTVLLIIQIRSRARFNSSLKDYKSGLKILKSLLVLINFGLTVSIFIQAAGARDIGTPFQVAVIAISITWAVFQIGFQITRIKKRHKALKSKERGSKEREIREKNKEKGREREL